VTTLFHSEPECSFSLDTSVGNNEIKVPNLSKITTVVVNALKTGLLELVVFPNMEDFPIPKLKGQHSGMHSISNVSGVLFGY
jgi:hypothetical protein